MHHALDVRIREQAGLKWGTPQPITVRDAEFGERLGGSGSGGSGSLPPGGSMPAASAPSHASRFAEFQRRVAPSNACAPGPTASTLARSQ
mgnify:CR=1 FL=1